jgi:hypothetical protein
MRANASRHGVPRLPKLLTGLAQQNKCQDKVEAIEGCVMGVVQFRSLSLAACSVVVLCTTSCGSGGSSAARVLPGSANSASAQRQSASVTRATEAATLQVTMPLSPQDVSAPVRSIALTPLAIDGSRVSEPAVTTNVSPGAGSCDATDADGRFVCTVTAQLPIGTDDVQIAAFDGRDGAGQLLSLTRFLAAIIEGKLHAFSASCVPTYIVPVGVVGGGTSANAFVFDAAFTAQPGTLPASPASYNSARFNASRLLYILDTDYDKIDTARYVPRTGFAPGSTLTGLPPQAAGVTSNFGFDVSRRGSAGVVNTDGSSPQLDIYKTTGATPPTTPTATFSSSNFPPSTFEAINPYVNEAAPVTAVLEDARGRDFGVAYSVGQISGSGAPDEIVVVPIGGGSETEVNPVAAGITSQYVPDVYPGLMTWNAGRQTLIYANAHSQTSNTVLELPRSGTSGASLTTTGEETVATIAGEPDFIAASQDGHYVAVAVATASSIIVSIYDNSGTTGGSGSWSLSSTATGSGSLGSTSFNAFTSMHFLSNDDLVVANSTTDGSVQQLYEFATSGAPVIGVTSISSTTGASFDINDVAVSY